MNIKNRDKQSEATVKIWSRPAIWLYCIILSVALLASFTLAWYVDSVEASDNKILTSKFEMTAKIENGESQITLTADDDGAQTATLTAGTYTVTLGCSNKTNGHGSCVVTLNGEAAQTVVFGSCGTANCDKCAGRNLVQFSVTVPEGATWQISLEPHWGTQVLVEGAERITSGAALGAAN